MEQNELNNIRILWGAFTVAPLMYIFIAYIYLQEMDVEALFDVTALGGMWFVAASGVSAILLFFAHNIISNKKPGKTFAEIKERVILQSGLAEAVAIIGLIATFVFENLIYVVIFSMVAVISQSLLYPKDV